MYEDVRRVVGPKRTLEILSLLSRQGTLNYTDIEQEIDTSSDVVSSSLDTLVEYGLTKRMRESQRDVRYAITEKGRALLKNINEIDTRLAE